MAGIIIEVDLDTGEVKKGFDRLKKTSTKEGSRVGKGFEKGLTKSVSVIDIAVGNILANVATQSLAAVSNFVRGSITAANRQEDAINNLNAALKRSGDFSEAASKDLQDFASSIQAISVFGDEAVLEQLAFAKSLGLTAEQSKEVVTAAVNLSSALGIGLDSATRNIAKTFSGLQGELGELLPSLRGLTQEQLRAGEAAKLVNQEFAGAAQARIETARGSYDQLSNAVGDLAEALGSIVTQSESVASATQSLTGFFQDLTAIINPSGQSISSQIDNTREAISRLEKDIAKLDRVGSSGSAIESRRQQLKLLEDQLKSLTGVQQSNAAEALRVQQESAGKTTEINQVEAEKRLTAIQNLGLSEIQSLETKLATEQLLLAEAAELKLITEEDFLTRSFELRRQFDEAEREILGEQQDPLEAFAQSFIEQITGIESAQDAFAERTKAFAATVASTLKQGIANGASNAFGAFGKALASGENGLEAFAQAFLASIGQTAIQLGTAFILEGIGFSFLGDPRGPGLIGAGAALATFGGALSALSGGAPSVAGASSAESQPSSPSLNPVSETPQEDIQERSIGVTVNIQGDVLDSEESSLRIAELLQKAVNDQGFKVA